MIGLTADTGTLFLIAIGPFIGSFIMTLAIRWPEGPSIFTGRSACRSCAARLAWFDLIPVLSWIVRRGCCGSCATPIGPMYPLTELAALAVGIWATTQFGGKDLLLACMLGWTLLALAVIDLRTMLLPDLLTLPVLVVGLFVAATDGRLAASLVGAVLGFAVFAIIATVYRRWRGRDGLGLGDAKLLGAAGAWVGWTGLPSIVLIASVTALVVTLPMVIRGAGSRVQREIAFGPYLAGATWMIVLYGPLVVV